MPRQHLLTATAATAILLASAAVALAAEPALTPALVFQHAAPAPKLIILGLLGSTLAAVVVCILKLASGRRLSGGSAFLSGLRVGGPLAGLMGAAWGAFNMCLGLANSPVDVPLNVIARGLAEAALLVVLGLLAGAVAVIANWAVEARIDRAVLKG